MLKTRGISDFGFFWVTDHLDTQDQTTGEWDPGQDMTFIHCSEIPIVTA